MAARVAVSFHEGSGSAMSVFERLEEFTHDHLRRPSH
jgi:hypothetical protein